MKPLVPVCLALLAACAPPTLGAEVYYASDHVADPSVVETVHLWDEGAMPATTEYTVNWGGWSDGPDFRPYVTVLPLDEGVEAKGAVMVCPGGAFAWRSDEEGLPVAQELVRLGYVPFIVGYRVRPYTMDESALDLARAVRYARSSADVYGYPPDAIAAVGFSAGGILAGHEALYYDGNVTPDILDADYRCDSLDEVDADLAVIGMIYSFYGRLSVASYDTGSFIEGRIPPTYFRYGTKDPFVSQFPRCAQAVREAGVPVVERVMEGWPHGFGAEGGWIADFCAFLDGYMLED